jgi:adenylate cyclase
MTRDQRRLAAIVSTDVVGYSLLMGRDEGGTLAALKALRRELVDPKIAEYGGRIVKTTGDGLLLEFPSVVDAVRCSVDVQRGIAERNADVADDRRILLRIGINVGDIIIDEDDIFGDGVNVAARLQALADPGGICVSRAVRDQVLDKLSFAFQDLGPKEVKNIVRPVDVYRVAMDTPPAMHAVPAVPPLPAQTGWTKRRAGAAIAAMAAVAVLAGAVWMTIRATSKPAVVAPYSVQDRRMTFAVLPIVAPANDPEGAKVASSMTDAAFVRQERRTNWAQVAPRRSVDEALARHAALKDIASQLDVRFLLRGNMTPDPTGHTIDLTVVDASNERALGSKSLRVPDGKVTRRVLEDLDNALGFLTYKAVEAEVQRARDKPLEALDVRDLSFRAYVDWNAKKGQKDEQGAYLGASELLNRALALAPDDSLALWLTARVNLCDCVQGWSKNIEEQEAIGIAALERYLNKNPGNAGMLVLKAQIEALHGRYEQALLLTDAALKRDAEDTDTLGVRAWILLKLGRAREAQGALAAVIELRDQWDDVALAASIAYSLGDYERSAQFAQQAKAEMSREELRSRRYGAVALTLTAAEARLGRTARAKAAYADFVASVPDATTIAAIRKWIHPAADLAGYEPLYEGLRLAGVAN